MAAAAPRGSAAAAEGILERVGAALQEPAPGHTGHAERWLRRRADQLLKSHADLFNRVRAEKEAVEVTELLDGMPRPESGAIRTARLESRGLAEPAYRQPWKDDEGGVLVHLIELLTWADDIAGDGYTTRPD